MKHFKLFFTCLLMAVLSIGQVWATDISFGYSNWDGVTESFSGSSKDEVTQTVSGIVVTYTRNGASLYANTTSLRLYKSNTLKFEAPSGYNITAITFTGSGWKDDVTTDEATCTASTSALSWSGEATSVTFTRPSTASSYATLTTASVTLTASGGTPTCATPTFSPAAGAVASGTEVTISTTTEGATIYYTTNGDDPTTSDATAQPIEITSATTIKAIAVKDGNNNSAVATAEYTVLTPLTTMDQIFEAATTAGSTATNVLITFNNWVVTGVKNSNAYVTDGTKGFIIYTSSHGFHVGDILSGTATCKVQLYNGSAELTELPATKVTVNTGGSVSPVALDADGIAALTGVNTGSVIKISGECTSETVGTKTNYFIAGVQLYNSLYSYSVSAGTGYDCTGVYVQYNSTKEVLPRSAADIVETSTVAVTSVTLTESTASVEAGETVTLHASVVPDNATNKNIIWSVQSGSDYASVSNAGVVTGIAAGEAVIRAAAEADETKYAECTVTVTAADPTKHVVTFNATSDTGESPLTKSNITFSCTNAVLNNGSEYRLYKNSTTTFACSVGNIIKIEFTGVSGNPVSGFEDPEVGTLETAGNDGVWTGDAASVSFVASGAQVRATLINVTYKEDTRAESGLAWNPAGDIEITVGDAFSAPALLNPNSIDAAEITIESSNPSVATVTAGVVALVADATGTTTITATFDGNATYKPATISYNITVNGGALTDYYEKATSIVEGTYLIVYEEGSVAFDGGLETLDATSNTIAVNIVSGNKIGVTSATEAATFYIDPTAGSIKAANGKYIGRTANTNGLNTSDEPLTNTMSIDGDGNAVIVGSGSTATYLRYNPSSGQERFRYFTQNQQPIALYKLANEVIKPEAGLAWSPAEDIEITVGDAFTPRTLLNPNGIAAGEITITSSNTSVATVDAGVVSLVENATGTTTIKASFAGNDDYKAAEVSYKIKVNPAHSIYVDKLNVNFGSVEKDAVVADKKITVTLTGVAAATLTLAGDGASAFTISPASALTESGDVTISASSATVGTYAATLTISDDAGEADSKVVNLSLTVTAPETPETPVSTTSKWVAAVAADIVDGAEVLITGVKSDETYAMSAASNNGNNRTSVAGTLNEGVFTPGENTMSFTLVATGAANTFYIKTSNDKYLYNASTSGNSYLRTKDNNEDASWTITLDGDGNAVITSVENTNRQLIRFNNGGSNALFNCYASGQGNIKLYVPQTPPTPTTVRSGLTPGNYYTICYPKAMKNVQGATLWSFVGKDASFAYIEQETAATIEAGKPYILYATAATVTAELEGDDAAAGTNGAIHGTSVAMDQTALDAAAATAGSDLYLVIGNELRRATGVGTSGNSLPANRAYVVLAEIIGGKPASAPGHHVVAMPLHRDATTGIDDINASEAAHKVMINGTMYILRGEKLYDATGRLVK